MSNKLAKQLSLFSEEDFGKPSLRPKRQGKECKIKTIINSTQSIINQKIILDKNTIDITSEFRYLFERLAKSKFRSSFHLHPAEYDYIKDKGIEAIRRHATDFIAKRLAPSHIPNDGKQTPMRGHPVFIAQHATACCCRQCFAKWHHIPAGRALTDQEQEYAVSILMAWITKEFYSYKPPFHR